MEHPNLNTLEEKNFLKKIKACFFWRIHCACCFWEDTLCLLFLEDTLCLLFLEDTLGLLFPGGYTVLAVSGRIHCACFFLEDTLCLLFHGGQTVLPASGGYTVLAVSGRIKMKQDEFDFSGKNVYIIRNHKEVKSEETPLWAPQTTQAAGCTAPPLF